MTYTKECATVLCSKGANCEEQNVGGKLGTERENKVK